MNVLCTKARRVGTTLTLAMLVAPEARAEIMGVMGPAFALQAAAGYISSPDGDSIPAWGYGVDGATTPMQYPGPTLIVNQGDIVTINLTNHLHLPVSIVFPGQRNVVATGDAQGLLTWEAGANGGTAYYTFVAEHPGTYLYHSGTRPELEIEMGLFGALIVRPAGAPKQAYEHATTAFDHEYLFLLSELDPVVHDRMATSPNQPFDISLYRPVSWAINGRMAPDTMAPAGAPDLPYQPYDCMPRMHPGEKVLMRVLGAGRDPHPLHTHGNHMTVIARDGRLLQSTPGAGPDLALADYTLTVSAGATYDALWTWTGEKLGWDIYGHAAQDSPQPGEYAPDHGKPFPVVLPPQQSVTIGPHYSGSPFLGAFGTLPPGTVPLNANGGMFFMFHSHTEREMVTNDIFPGGMMTMMIIEPPGVPIP